MGCLPKNCRILGYLAKKRFSPITSKSIRFREKPLLTFFEDNQKNQGSKCNPSFPENMTKKLGCREHFCANNKGP